MIRSKPPASGLTLCAVVALLLTSTATAQFVALPPEAEPLLDAANEIACDLDLPTEDLTGPCSYEWDNLLAAGNYHNCLITAQRNVECWGSNDRNQAAGYDGGDAQSVGAGYLHSCVLTTGGNVHCWGDGSGQGELIEYTEGDAKFLEVAVDQTCIIRTDDAMQCWGKDRSGGTGWIPDVAHVSAGAGTTTMCYVTTDGNGQCFGRYVRGIPHYTGGDAIQVAASSRAACYLLESGNTHCVGAYGDAQEYAEGDATHIAGGAFGGCLYAAATTSCWGVLASPVEEDGEVPLTVDMGLVHACILVDIGEARCGGHNWWGQATDYSASS